MKEQVSHKGRVIRMTPQTTTVAIEQHAACSTCHAAGLCGMADVAERPWKCLRIRMLLTV